MRNASKEAAPTTTSWSGIVVGVVLTLVIGGVFLAVKPTASRKLGDGLTRVGFEAPLKDVEKQIETCNSRLTSTTCDVERANQAELRGALERKRVSKRDALIERLSETGRLDCARTKLSNPSKLVK